MNSSQSETPCNIACLFLGLLGFFMKKTDVAIVGKSDIQSEQVTDAFRR